MSNDSNRVLWKLKSKPNEGFAVDFKSITVKGGIITIETFLETKELRYEEIDGSIAIWPRAWPGANPLENET